MSDADDLDADLDLDDGDAMSAGDAAPDPQPVESDAYRGPRELRDAYDRLKGDLTAAQQAHADELAALHESYGKQAAFVRDTVLGRLGIAEQARGTVAGIVEQAGVDWTDGDAVQQAIEAAGLIDLIGRSYDGPPPLTTEERERVAAQQRTEALFAAGRPIGVGSTPNDDTADAVARGDIPAAINAQTRKLADLIK